MCMAATRWAGVRDEEDRGFALERTGQVALDEHRQSCLLGCNCPKSGGVRHGRAGFPAIGPLRRPITFVSNRLRPAPKGSDAAGGDTGLTPKNLPGNPKKQDHGGPVWTVAAGGAIVRINSEAAFHGANRPRRDPLRGVAQWLRDNHLARAAVDRCPAVGPRAPRSDHQSASAEK